MLVYRICDKHEVDQILSSNSCKEVGFFYRNKLKSTHNYEEGKLYMHFFGKPSDIFYLDLSKGRFICTYEIPEELLQQHGGFTEYIDFINFINICKVREYAIPGEMVDFEYLQKAELIDSYLEYKDFWYNPSLDGQVKTYYKSKQLTKNRK